jgi:hypothetical protein
MEDPKPALPALLPWAATACLAALVACVGELLFMEKARTRLLRDENLLSQAALKSSENQLEAERILGRRERAEFGVARGTGADLRVMLLTPMLPVSPIVAPSGAVVVDPGTNVCLLRVSNIPGERPDRDFQLWLLGPGPNYPADCGTFHSFPPGNACVCLKPPQPVVDGCTFILVYGGKGGAKTFKEATSNGWIELATRPQPGNITSR